MSPIVNAVGWALLHFIWQGALITLIFAVAIRLLRTAEARYALGVAAMLAMLVLPVVTGLRYASRPVATAAAAPSAVEPSPPADVSYSAAARTDNGALTSSPRPSDSNASAGAGSATTAQSPVVSLRLLQERLPALLPILVGLWLAGVLVLSLRLFDAWLHARRLTREGTRPAPESLRLVLERLAGRLGIRRPLTVLESTTLWSPAVVGWLRPVVLLPAVALTGLTAQQVEALIAHELAAHVLRRDYLANIIQSAIETLLFYHPAVWYVSRRVREEREHCCDDVAVRIAGSPDAFARALLRIAESRPEVPALAAAATGGPLFGRVRRLLAPDTVPADTFPRWVVGSTVLVAAALIATVGGSLEANEARDRATITEEHPAAIQRFVADTDRVGADTVLHAPPGPLAARWQWARDEAKRRGDRAFWVGYTIDPIATKENRPIYVGRLERRSLDGPGVSLRGRIVNFGDFEGFRVPGVQLAPLVGGGMPDDVAVLFLYTLGRNGRATLARVHASSLVFPVDLEGRPVFWLGEASDGESVPLVRRLYDDAATAELREDVVAMVGIHSSHAVVVPVLLEWVEGRAADGVRGEAVEWLGRHPDARALSSLAGTARRDRAPDVRREAAESVAEMDLPAATDTLIGLARTLEDREARREAVEGLGERGDDRSVDALAGVIRSDADQDVRREGAESLGESRNPRSIPLLVEIARSHPDVEVRREAVETIGENVPAAEAVRVLGAIARSDRSIDVQREAIESLGEMKDRDAIAIVEELAKSHPNVDARREAIETLGEAAPDGATVEKLARLAREETNADVVHEAIETIAETQHADATRIIADLARTHRSAEVRREATETLAEVGDRRAAVRLLGEIAERDQDADVRREAVETLGELHEAAAVDLLAGFARNHPDMDARREAVETLGESASPERFIAIARELLDANPSEEVWHEVLETLEELKGGAGIPTLISTARSHGNVEVRKHALEQLAESDDPRARRVFEDALSR